MTRTSQPRRLLPSLGQLVFAATLLLLVLMDKGASRLLGDSDTGWHIRTGEWILAERAVPQADLYSFSKPGEQWIAWEWLADVLLALTHGLWGLEGVALGAALLIALVFAVLFRFLLARGADVLAATALALTAAYASSIHWLARPHLLGWALALAFYAVLERTAPERRGIFWLAPLAALWANLHGSFVLAFYLVGLYGLGALLVKDWIRARRYGFVLLTCAAATVLNPYGLRAHWHIFSYLRNSYIRDHITEFFSPNFHAPAALFYEVLLLAGVLSAVWAARRGRWAQALLVLSFAHFSLVSARHIPLYVLFAAPLIGDALTAALASSERFGELARFSAGIRSLELVPRLPVLPALAVGLAVLAPGPGFDTRHFPIAAADHLLRGSFGGNVFSTDQWSGYLIYRGYPRVRVFMDGRSDYYGAKLGELYLNLMSVHHTWQETLDRYRVQTVLLPVNSGLAGALKESSQWKVTYDDGVAIVFQPARQSASLAALAGPNQQP